MADQPMEHRWGHGSCRPAAACMVLALPTVGCRRRKSFSTWGSSLAPAWGAGAVGPLGQLRKQEGGAAVWVRGLESVLRVDKPLRGWTWRWATTAAGAHGGFFPVALPLIHSLLLKVNGRTKGEGRLCAEAGGCVVLSGTHSFLIFVLGGAVSRTAPADRIQEIKERGFRTSRYQKCSF